MSKEITEVLEDAIRDLSNNGNPFSDCGEKSRYWARKLETLKAKLQAEPTEAEIEKVADIIMPLTYKEYNSRDLYKEDVCNLAKLAIKAAREL